MQQGIIDAKAVIFHAALEQHQQFLLARQAFENLQQLAGARIQGVIEFHLMRVRALLPAKRFFAKVGDFSVDVQVLSLKVIQLLGEREHFGAQSRADLEFCRTGIIVELANFVAGVVGVFAHGNFDELRRARLEDAAKCQFGSG